MSIETRNKILFAIFMCMLVVIGLIASKATYSFMEPSGSQDFVIEGEVVAEDSLHQLTLTKGEDISVTLNTSNFNSSSGNVVRTTTSQAKLISKDNSTTITDDYSVGIRINENTFQYTNGSEAEIILSVTDPNGNPVTKTVDLTYVTVGGVSGFDITTKNGFFNIVDREITANTLAGTIENWTFTITFLNKSNDQSTNEDASISLETLLFLSPIQLASRHPVCNDATYDWNRSVQKLEVSAISSNSLNCTLENDVVAYQEYLNDYIISLCNSEGTMSSCNLSTASSQGTGELVYEHGIRYEGKDPNNYIWFNNELWRIIGVFDSSSHGRSGENLVKLIRVDSIGSYAWNGVSDRANDWPNSTLYRMLNGCYLYQKKGNETINLEGQSDLCSTYAVGYYDYFYNYGVLLGYGDFSKIGIVSEYRNMIVDTTWYLGGGGKSGYTRSTQANTYSYERDASAIYSGRSTSTTGKIGLMYLSDYGYSVLSSSCGRGTFIKGTYSSTSCCLQSWLYGEGDEWVLTPNSKDAVSAWSITSYGSGESGDIAHGYSVRPVLYLSTNVYRISGNGSLDEPYIIGMAIN